jgi:hypothetical protein
MTRKSILAPRSTLAPLPDKEEIRCLIDELHAELTSDDRQTAQEAARLCRALSLRAAERWG